MNERKSKEDAFTTSRGASTTIITSSGATHPRQQMVQEFLLIWVDASINESTQECQDTMAQFRTVVKDAKVFTQPNQCIQFLYEIKNEKVFVIAPGYLGQYLVPDIHALPQVDTVYILCGNSSRHKQWTKKWSKINGVYTDINSICQALQVAVKQCNQASIAVSFVTANEANSSTNLDQLEPSFMYTQIFKEILLKMEYDKKSIKDLAVYCRKFYHDNVDESDIIDEFEHNYRSHTPIWWYTRNCFIYKMLNRSLRMLESDTIINMGFFIRDLHQQIEQLYQKQVGSYCGKPFLVYRGQGLSTTDFEKLQKTKGGLMSFNSFLSTSTDRDVSLVFAEQVSAKINSVTILFTMTIDPSISSAPFASITEDSYFPTEGEILFSMHTVFRIDEITKIDNHSSLYQVDLKLTADDDQELRTLTERIREEMGGETEWERLGQLLIKLKQFDTAEGLYSVLLVETSDESKKAFYYDQMGYIKNGQGDYTKAIEYNEKGLKIRQKTLPENDPLLATSYNNIGLVYNNMGENWKALSFYEKVLEIHQKTLSPNQSDLATLYINIGKMYFNMGEYSEALSLCEKALEIRQKTLPANHPDFAQSYNNIGLIYNNMGEYSQALSFYRTVLEIYQKTLPADHPDFATSYNNIGLVYNNMGEYSQALSFYEKAFKIYQKTVAPSHPDLATSYNNIASVYGDMGENSKALSLHEKALEIRQKSLPANHSDFAQSYNNIGLVYYNMRDYSNALSFFERAQNICQSSLPANLPIVKIVQENIELLKEKLKK